MTRRDKTVLTWLTAVLALCAALGVLAVLTRSDAARVAAFANRFTGFDTLAFTAPAEVTCAAEAESLSVAWAAGSDGFAAQSAAIPLAAAGAVQADVYIGGTRNYQDGAYVGFRAWLTLTLLRQGEAVGQASAPLPLASDKGRRRLYSVRAQAQGAQADAYTLCLTVEPTGGALPAGELTCAWLEVTP